MSYISVAISRCRGRRDETQRATFISLEGRRGDDAAVIISIRLDGPDPETAPMEVERIIIADAGREGFDARRSMLFYRDWCLEGPASTTRVQTWDYLVDAIGARVALGLNDYDLRYLLPDLKDRTIPPPRPKAAPGFPVKVCRTVYGDVQALTGSSERVWREHSTPFVLYQLVGQVRRGDKGQEIVPAVHVHVQGIDPEADDVDVETFAMTPHNWSRDWVSKRNECYSGYWALEREEDHVRDEAELAEALGARIFGELGKGYGHLIPGEPDPPRIILPPRRVRYLEAAARSCKPKETAPITPPAPAVPVKLKPPRRLPAAAGVESAPIIAPVSKPAPQSEPTVDLDDPHYGLF